MSIAHSISRVFGGGGGVVGEKLSCCVFRQPFMLYVLYISVYAEYSIYQNILRYIRAEIPPFRLILPRSVSKYCLDTSITHH